MNNPAELFPVFKKAVMEQLTGKTVCLNRIYQSIRDTGDDGTLHTFPENAAISPCLIIGPVSLKTSVAGNKSQSRVCNLTIEIIVGKNSSEAATEGLPDWQWMHSQKELIADQILTELEKTPVFRFQGAIPGQVFLTKTELTHLPENDLHPVVQGTLKVSFEYRKNRLLAEGTPFSEVLNKTKLHEKEVLMKVDVNGGVL